MSVLGGGNGNDNAALLPLGWRRKNREVPMEEDDRPKKKVVHEIGCDLSLLSVEELKARIELMREEIARLDANIVQKQASKSAADSFFKR